MLDVKDLWTRFASAILCTRKANLRRRPGLPTVTSNRIQRGLSALYRPSITLIVEIRMQAGSPRLLDIAEF